MERLVWSFDEGLFSRMDSKSFWLTFDGSVSLGDRSGKLSLMVHIPSDYEESADDIDTVLLSDCCGRMGNEALLIQGEWTHATCNGCGEQFSWGGNSIPKLAFWMDWAKVPLLDELDSYARLLEVNEFALTVENLLQWSNALDRDSIKSWATSGDVAPWAIAVSGTDGSDWFPSLKARNNILHTWNTYSVR